jgi:hypothetical protein
MNINLSEDEFYALVDANLPYQRPLAVHALIRIGTQYSANMAFVLLNEICRPPFSKLAEPDTLLGYLKVWDELFDHPLKTDLMNLARLHIAKEEVSVSAAISIMDKIAIFSGEYAALNIAYMACDDIEGLADRRNDEIRAAWEALV